MTRNLNSPLSSTASATYAAIKATLTSPDIPFNHGMTQPVTLHVPYPSLLNPQTAGCMPAWKPATGCTMPS